MLAMRGGISLGALITGAAVSIFGIQHVLLFNGIAAVVLQLMVAQMWFKEPDNPSRFTSSQ